MGDAHGCDKAHPYGSLADFLTSSFVFIDILGLFPQKTFSNQPPAFSPRPIDFSTPRLLDLVLCFHEHSRFVPSIFKTCAGVSCLGRGVLSAMREVLREPFPRGPFSESGWQSMRCMVPYGPEPSHLVLTIVAYQAGPVKRQRVLYPVGRKEDNACGRRIRPEAFCPNGWGTPYHKVGRRSNHRLTATTGDSISWTPSLGSCSPSSSIFWTSGDVGTG